VDKHVQGTEWPLLIDAKLIPDSWADQFLPALQYWREHHALFYNSPPPARRKALGALTADRNPFIAFFACRALGAAGGLGPADLSPKDMGALDERGILMVYLLLRSPAQDASADLYKELSSRVAAAKSPEQLYGIACACALDLATLSVPGLPTHRPSFRLLEQIETRIAEWSKENIPDPYLYESLQGVRRVRHEIDVIEKVRRAQKRGRESS
jgi:hypothetical protein